MLPEVRPFVYIASGVRTGSTVLAEALTRPPESWIHLESLLADGRLSIYNVERLYGDDPAWRPVLDAYRLARRSGPRDGYVERFKADVLPLLEEQFEQVGVKEIYHGQWRRFVALIPDVRVVVTVRDPRDVYLSLMEMRRHNPNPDWRWADMALDQMAAEVARQWRHLLEISESTEALIVHYEDLCTRPEYVFAQVRGHIGSALEGPAPVGWSNREHPIRGYEPTRHRGSISAATVNRWQRVPSRELAEADRFAALVGEAAAHFGYQES